MGLFDIFKKVVGPAKAQPVKAAYAAGVVCSPASGELVQLSETTEPLFSSEAMGKGVAIRPSTGTIYAPVSGAVTAIIASQHAVGMLADDGAEVLVHVGVDTVEMKGDGFVCHVAQGDRVSAGDPILVFSKEKIAAAGFDDTVFMVVTNTDDYAEVAPAPDGPVEAGSVVVRLTR